jgi:hypothetical protein
MAETSIFGPDERVELVRGVIRQMTPKNRAHVIAVDTICGLSGTRFEAGRACTRRLRSSLPGSTPNRSPT